VHGLRAGCVRDDRDGNVLGVLMHGFIVLIRDPSLLPTPPFPFSLFHLFSLFFSSFVRSRMFFCIISFLFLVE